MLKEKDNSTQEHCNQELFSHSLLYKVENTDIYVRRTALRRGSSWWNHKPGSLDVLMPIAKQSVMNNDEVRKRKMTDINANQKIRSDGPAWYFLGELLISEILAFHRRDELTDGLWVQTVCELSMPLECVDNIKKTLTGFASDAWVKFEQEKLDVPGRVRLFCQKKIIDNANSTEITPYHAEHPIDLIKGVHPSVAKIKGGWGYFVIEKGGDVLTDSSNSVDLYLYKEGE